MPMNVASERKGKDKAVKGLNSGRRSTGANGYGEHAGDQKTTASNPALSAKYGAYKSTGQNKHKV